ncbi:MAG: sulfotransferase [Planctomycetota bacterium]
MGKASGGESRNTLAQRIAAAAPFAKILVWAGWTFTVSLLVQLLFCGLGLQQQVFVQPPLGVKAIAALVGLAVLSLADHRPMSDYGLTVTRTWGRQLAGGYALGFGLAGVWCALCYVGQVAGPCDPARWGALIKTAPVVVEALIGAFVIQIVFSGYIFSIVRERHGAATAVIVPAILLPLMYRIDSLPAIVTHGEWQRFVWLFLMQLLAGVLRLRSGQIMLATGLIAGFASLRRMVRKTGVLDEVLHPDRAAWFYPEGDLQRAPAIWIVTAAAVFLLALAARRGGAPAAAGEGGIPVSLKRLYPFAMPMTFAPLDVQFTCLWAARGRIAWSFLPRAIAILILSTINTVLNLPERLLSPLLRQRRVLDPIFVVGVHRSGTTHLHNLLALDPQLVAPRHFQVLNPGGALLCGWPLTGVLAAFFPWRRPMDNMSSHVFSPGEEEFALANLCHVSPYWGWVFPRRAAAYDRYLCASGFTPRENRIWKRAYLSFLHKLVLWSGKRPVLKNPCNTGRLELLLELFPDARIVHIHRHPHDVYRSNVHFAREAHCLFQLQDPLAGHTYTDRFLSAYAAMESNCYRVAAELPANRFVDVRFEDLEADPLGQIARIYAQLELEFDQRFRQRLESYLGSVADYRKNRFRPLAEPVQREILQHIGPLLQRWGYGPQPPALASGPDDRLGEAKVEAGHPEPQPSQVSSPSRGLAIPMWAAGDRNCPQR